MHESKKSDLAVVAVKPTNKAGSISAAEPVEPRAGAEGNVVQQSTHRTQIRARVSQALERVRQAAKQGRRNGSLRCSTTSISICYGCRFARSSVTRHRGRRE